MRKIFATLCLLPGLTLASETRQTVFTAEVLTSRTLPPTAGSRLLTTELDVAVRTCLSGDCPERTVITVPGGKLGHIEQWVDDALPPDPGAVVAVTVPEVPADAKLRGARRFARLLTLETAARPVIEPKPSGSEPTPPVRLTPAPTR